MAYNGWSNYETWAAHLWLDNTEEVQRHILQRLSDFGYDVNAIELYIKELHEVPDCEHVQNTVYAYLLRGALDSVNWREIATALVEDNL